jgi:hypothetical protein
MSRDLEALAVNSIFYFVHLCKSDSKDACPVKESLLTKSSFQIPAFSGRLPFFWLGLRPSADWAVR